MEKENKVLKSHLLFLQMRAKAISEGFVQVEKFVGLGIGPGAELGVEMVMSVAINAGQRQQDCVSHLLGLFGAHSKPMRVINQYHTRG